MKAYGSRHHDRKHHGKLTKGWIFWIPSKSKASRRAAKKHARQDAKEACCGYEI